MLRCADGSIELGRLTTRRSAQRPVNRFAGCRRPCVAAWRDRQGTLADRSESGTSSLAADSGCRVHYALVDDRHFLVTGVSISSCHAPLWTESDGKRIALFPIDERLRYLIPFRHPRKPARICGSCAGRSSPRRMATTGRIRRLARYQGVGVRSWLAGCFMATIGELVQSGDAMLSR